MLLPLIFKIYRNLLRINNYFRGTIPLYYILFLYLPSLQLEEMLRFMRDSFYLRPSNRWLAPVNVMLFVLMSRLTICYVLASTYPMSRAPSSPIKFSERIMWAKFLFYSRMLARTRADLGPKLNYKYKYYKINTFYNLSTLLIELILQFSINISYY